MGGGGSGGSSPERSWLVVSGPGELHFAGLPALVAQLCLCLLPTGSGLKRPLLGLGVGVESGGQDGDVFV